MHGERIFCCCDVTDPPLDPSPLALSTDANTPTKDAVVPFGGGAVVVVVFVLLSLFVVPPFFLFDFFSFFKELFFNHF